MAFQMSYVASTGVVCPNSYWLPTQVILNTIPTTGQITFTGWASHDAFAAGLESVGVKDYQINPAIYAAFISAVQTHPEGFGTLASVYALAQAVCDCPDSQGAAVSFFANATEV